MTTTPLASAVQISSVSVCSRRVNIDNRVCVTHHYRVFADARVVHRSRRKGLPTQKHHDKYPRLPYYVNKYCRVRSFEALASSCIPISALAKLYFTSSRHTER